MADSNSPIGVFDSGVGGISVLRELVRLMPGEDYIYFGDSIHAPYGTKKLEEVRELTIHNVELLLENGAKSIVVACNTATSAAVAVLRKMYPDVPLVGIEPAIKPAVMNKPDSNIIVMATPMTLREKKFHNLMQKFQDQAEIIPLPCPGLVEFVEAGQLDTPELRAYLASLLEPVLARGADAIVLGCTHFPFLRPLIQELAGPQVEILDGGHGTALQTRRRLEAEGLLRESTQGLVELYNSLGAPEILQRSAGLLGL